MNLTTVKMISGGVLFLVALIGTVLSKYASSFSPKIVRVCNALSGGILLAITLVHMLADTGDQLEKPGRAIAAAFGPSAAAFPLGFALAGLGFLTILSVEVFLPGGGHDKDTQQVVEDLEAQVTEDSDSEQESEDKDGIIVLPTAKSCVAGLSAVIGLCLHSLIEGTATGAADDMSEFSQMFLAIIAHKVFAVFSMGSLLLHSVSAQTWWALMLVLSLMTPVGVAIGAVLAASMEGPSAAGLVCFAAGSLLCVAVYDMLMPSLLLGKGHWKRRSFLASLFGFCAMSLLAMWS